jgi:anti-sigma B factor antagonist
MSQAGFTSDREQLEIAVWQESQDSVIVVLSGELDVATTPTLQWRLADLFELGITHMVMDFANLTFIDSVGVSLLITAAKRVRVAEGTLTVRNANRPVTRVFQITGLMDFFSMSPDGDSGMVTGTTESGVSKGAA